MKVCGSSPHGPIKYERKLYKKKATLLSRARTNLLTNLRFVLVSAKVIKAIAFRKKK